MKKERIFTEFIKMEESLKILKSIMLGYNEVKNNITPKTETSKALWATIKDLNISPITIPEILNNLSLPNTRPMQMEAAQYLRRVGYVKKQTSTGKHWIKVEFSYDDIEL